MTLLNRASDGLSTVLLTAVRGLRKLGPRNEEEFKALLAPGTMADSAAKKIQQTLTRWTQLGLFEVDDGTISLSEEFAKLEVRHERQPDLRELRKATLTLALRSARDQQDTRADDAVAGSWWFLSTDPFHYPVRNWADAQRIFSGTGVDDYLIQNDTRWAGLLDWMQFWGLIKQAYGNLPIIPNPADAITWHLTELLPGKESIPVMELLNGLGDVLPIIPVLKDGAVDNPISSKLPVASRPLEERRTHLSVSLSLALNTLEERGLIKLHSHDIADRWHMTDVEGKTITHLARAG
jgi:hypothetical protein